MALAIIPSIIATGNLWDPPEELRGDSGKLFGHLFWWLMLTRIAMSLFDTPSDALANELTGEAEERTKLVNARVVVGWVGGTALGVLITRAYLLPSAEGKDDGFFNEEGYRSAGWLLAWVTGVAMAVATLGTSPHIPSMLTASGDAGGDGGGQPQGPRGVQDMLARVLEPLGIWNVKVWLVASIIGETGHGLTYGLAPYYQVFFFHFTPKETSWFMVFSAGAVVYSTRAVPRIAARLGKHNGVIRLAYLNIWLDKVPIILRLLGLLWPNGSAGLFLFFLVTNSVEAALGACQSTLAMSLFTDIVEEGSARLGRRDEAMFVAAVSFCSRVAFALGLLLSGFVAHVAGVGSDKDATTPEQSRNMALIHVPIAIAISLTAVRWFNRYREEDTSQALEGLEEAKLRRLEQMPAFAAGGMVVAKQMALLNASRGAASHEAHGIAALGIDAVGDDGEAGGGQSRTLVRAGALRSDDPGHELL